jgi:hypothetical protein
MPNGNENGGARIGGKMVLELEYDCTTFQVTVGGTPMPVSLAQSICDEASRLLAEQRRVAAAMQLSRQMAEQANAAEIVRRVGSGRH